MRKNVALMALVLAASACSPPPAQHPGGGDRVFTIATDAEPVCWDPHVDPSSATADIQRNVLDSLTHTDGDGTVRPWLAESWEVSDDQLAYTFHLRRDVDFHDGTPLTAEAVEANLDRIADPGTASQNAAELLGPYAGTEVVDEHTAVVRFERPHASFLRAASTANLGLYSPAALAEGSEDLCAGGPAAVGSGPFRFTEAVPGQRAEFTRNDAYSWWPDDGAEPGAARLPHVVYRFAADNHMRTGLLRSGQVDAVTSVPPSGVAALNLEDRIWSRIQASPGSPFSLYLNTERPPFDEREAREAVRAAVDVDTVVDAVFFGERERARAPLSSSLEFSEPAPEGSLEHDPDHADRLLDDLGYDERDADGFRTRDGEPLTVAWPYIRSDAVGSDDAVTVAVQQYLHRVGIRVELAPMELGSYLERRDSGDYDIVAFAWNVADPVVLEAVFGSGSQFDDGGVNGSRVRDPELDDLLRTGGSELDPDVRHDAYQQVQALVDARVYSVPLYPETLSVAAADTVHGLEHDANGSLPLRTTRVEARS